MPCLDADLSASDDGGVNSPAPPGNDNEPGAMNVFACAAFDGCVWMPSILQRVFAFVRVGRSSSVSRSVEELMLDGARGICGLPKKRLRDAKWGLK